MAASAGARSPRRRTQSRRSSPAGKLWSSSSPSPSQPSRPTSECRLRQPRPTCSDVPGAPCRPSPPLPYNPRQSTILGPASRRHVSPPIAPAFALPEAVSTEMKDDHRSTLQLGSSFSPPVPSPPPPPVPAPAAPRPALGHPTPLTQPCPALRPTPPPRPPRQRPQGRVL
ncbi:hypothetical protein DICSQDRAFT_169163 [Dichomitus squalens LYAD-421 SS1]|uniref:Uncharacterized protein n=1 Tax=Dichomitus squalens (strain LYAD-421) TaxID=732165 RepID=R7T128_DICSQ|nr:uncharacterized protein DICSQDRAFT_169163 [Dichomitus squalens LYAD-421 SS1]EJF62134.1 hypothetical protein DICSQDRAFT_169163 [Dichomitus squalens LYAD-421 SS1]